MTKNQLIWEAHQLKARLRDDTHRLKELAPISDLNILLPPLQHLVVAYWSEDERVVDIIINRPHWRLIKPYRKCRVKDFINVIAKLQHIEEINGYTNEWSTRIEFKISVTARGHRLHYAHWRYGDVFNTLLILPEIDSGGNEAPTDYSDWNMAGIALARNDLYTTLNSA